MPIKSINGEPIVPSDKSITSSTVSDELWSTSSLKKSSVVEAISGYLDTLLTSSSDNGLTIMDDGGNVFAESEDFVLSGRFDLANGRGVAIADGDMNVVFEASHGRQNTLVGKTFSIVGDSISSYSGFVPSGYATYYPRDDVNDVSKTWWKRLEYMTGMRLVSTASWSGSRVTGDSQSTTGEVGCSDARVSAVAGADETPDFIIVFMGTNDVGSGVVTIGDVPQLNVRPTEGDMQTFAESYLLLLFKLHEQYPSSYVFCATVLPRRQSETNVSIFTNALGNTIDDVNEIIKRLASAMNCGIIDFGTCGFNVWGMEDYFLDAHLHPNAAGMRVIANAARAALEANNNL